MRAAKWALAAILVLSASAAWAAEPASEPPLTRRTEKVSLKPHRVPGLLLGYGYTLGEFSGEVRQRASSVRAPLFSSDGARTTFTILKAGAPEPISVSCNGGQSLFALGWVTFDRDDLSYVCKYEGGPADAGFSLALSKGGGLARLAQPQRAAELSYGGLTLRAQTERSAGSILMGAGRAPSYQILRDGRPIAALMRGMISPTFYLPPQGSSDREAAAVMLLTLFFFADPADRPG